MVKKLIKYDFRSFFRLLFPVQVILVGIALINRIVQIFEDTDSTVYNAIFISSIVLYVVAIFVALIMTVVVCIVRFYQGMYSHEGYLSHTLPVTVRQHILAKLLLSMIFYFGSLLAVFVSFTVITFGEVNIELWKAFGYLMGQYFHAFGFEGAVYIIEFVLMLIALRVTTFLVYYFCISVGQLVSKKRILLAFGVYFGRYVLSQVVATIIIIIFALRPGFVIDLIQWAGEHPTLAVHLYLCFMLAYNLFMGWVYYFITKKIMSKKLNLT